MLLDEGEFRRWIESARRTLRSAVRDLEGGDYNWACFKAHQAAEKALKALLWGVGRPRVGHSLPKLLQQIEEELGIRAPGEVREACIRLNKLYTPTRYPDVWSEGIPEEYYSESEAREAISQAGRVIGWVEEIWRRLSGRGLGGGGKR
jgi:HEPN domain-containing protein